MIVPNTLSLDDDDDNDDDNNENNNNASSTERGGGVSMSSFSLSISVSSRVFFTCVCALMMATSFLGTHNFCVAAPITPPPPPTS